MFRAGEGPRRPLPSDVGTGLLTITHRSSPAWPRGRRKRDMQVAGSPGSRRGEAWIRAGAASAPTASPRPALPSYLRWVPPGSWILVGGSPGGRARVRESSGALRPGGHERTLQMEGARPQRPFERVRLCWTQRARGGSRWAQQSPCCWVGAGGTWGPGGRAGGGWSRPGGANKRRVSTVALSGGAAGRRGLWEAEKGWQSAASG